MYWTSWCSFLLGLAVVSAPLWAAPEGNSLADELPASRPAQEQPILETRIVGEPDASRFPDITVRFQILDAKTKEPARNLPDEEITIFENDKKVHSFRPVALKREPAAVVMALDTSGSMEALMRVDEEPTSDRPPRQRMEVARAVAGDFLRRLDPEAPCGLVLFHHQPWQIEPLQTERNTLQALIQSAQANGGTAYIDATSVAIQALANAELRRQRAVVLMTDGRDVNSKRRLDDVIKEAKRQQVRVFTVGLGDPARGNRVRTVLVLDQSGSMARGSKMPDLKEAARKFVELMPAQNADSTIIAFSNQVRTAGPFTSRKEELLEVIDRLQPEGETAFFDATYEAIETLIATGDLDSDTASRSVVVLTDGKDTDSRRRPRHVIDRALQGNIRVYLLGLGEKGDLNEEAMRQIARETDPRKSEDNYLWVRDSKDLTEHFEKLSVKLHDDGIDQDSLKKLARETDGKYYHVRSASGLAQEFERVVEQLESTYSVTFRSQRALHDSTKRRVRIAFGSFTESEAAYAVRGMIAPAADQGIYLILLALLGCLLAVPSLVRRFTRSPA